MADSENSGRRPRLAAHRTSRAPYARPVGDHTLLTGTMRGPGQPSPSLRLGPNYSRSLSTTP